MANELRAGDAPAPGKPAYSVRVRLTLWYATVTFLILCLLGASVRYTLRSALIRDADRGQTGFIHFMQGRSVAAGSLQDIIPQRMASRFQRTSEPGSTPDPILGKLWPRILDLKGNAISPILNNKAIDDSAFNAAADGKTVTTDMIIDHRDVRVMTAPLFQHGTEIGVIQAPRLLLDDEQTEDLRKVTLVMVSFIPVAVIVSALGALFLTGRAIDPVRQIRNSAALIGSSNLSDRLNVSGRDEFADLAMTFNGMLDRLEQGFTQLEQSYEQQRRFTGDASHELRTPLTIIKANASLALSQARSPEEYVSALRTIDHAADRTNKLIQDLLLLARADAGQLEIEKRGVRVDEMIQTAYSHIETVENGHGPKVVIEPITGEVAALVNQDMIVRLLDNLISNAWRHTPDGGEVRVSAAIDKESPELIRLTVSDTGEGIAPEHLPFLTDRFYRADASRVRTHGGTGLGLAICKSIVDLHGGAIKISSTLGKGTTVDVLLPRASGPLNNSKVELTLVDTSKISERNGSSRVEVRG
jgi:heavy metal sensor kinase